MVSDEWCNDFVEGLVCGGFGGDDDEVYVADVLGVLVYGWPEGDGVSPVADDFQAVLLDVCVVGAQEEVYVFACV